MAGRGWKRAFAVAVVLTTFAASCSSDDTASDDDPSTETSEERIDLTDYTSGDWMTSGSVGQVHVSDADPSTLLTLTRDDGAIVDEGTTDEEGSLIFRLVDNGDDFVVADTAAETMSDAVEVSDPGSSLPDQSFYDDQELVEGFQYITTRDGTKLSAFVYLPPGEGPFPTVVEYSGYDPSNPTTDITEALEDIDLGDPALLCESIRLVCNTPAQPGSIIAAAMDYAVVAVNMRGTGCSGGAYDFFEPLQLTDGYDIIETAAAQDWVRGNKVGMVGLSYPGISQLFVASTQPPSLAAITPLSVYEDTAKGTLAPGGMFNSGFALSWAENVGDKARAYGQGWEETVVEEDETHGPQCVENQKFRGQNVDAAAKAQDNEYYTDEVAGPVDPSTFVDRIEVPVFMTGAWQDEQTGPSWLHLWDDFENSPQVKMTGFNGAHADGFGPETLVEMKAFLDFYVAGERNPIPQIFKQFAPLLIGDVFKGAVLEFPEEPWLDGEFDELKAEFESAPDYRIIWERGGIPGEIGSPTGTAETRFDVWPPEDLEEYELFFGPDGSLQPDEPGPDGGAARYVVNPELGGKVTLPDNGQAFHALPEWDWAPDAAGDAVVAVSAPLDVDRAFLGWGSIDLWMRSSAPDAEIGVTLSEVRPDGQEMYVQTGLLRASLREPGPDATALDPDHTGREDSVAPMPVNEWEPVRIEMMPFGHIFRAGSRIRVSVHTAGGDKTRWAYILQHSVAGDTVDIAHDADHPSKIVLPLVPGVSGYPAEYPPCPSLRGQPCRDFVEYENTPTEV